LIDFHYNSKMDFKNKYSKGNTNKYDMHWQIVRTKARSIKDVDEKIAYVLKFLNDNPNIGNYNRVYNWLMMTKLGYTSYPACVRLFDEAAADIAHNIEKYNSPATELPDLKNFSSDELMLVYKDLKKRKYGFLIKSTPQSHIDFMHNLETELRRRHML